MAYRFRGRGRFTSPTSRSGRGYTFAGRAVRIQGENFQLNWNGPLIESMILGALEDAFSALSDEALAYMQSKVPVDTGALRDSCYVQVINLGERIGIAIGAGMPYAVYVELGTSSHKAQPFIRPTYDYVISRLPGIIRAEVARRGR